MTSLIHHSSESIHRMRFSKMKVHKKALHHYCCLILHRQHENQYIASLYELIFLFICLFAGVMASLGQMRVLCFRHVTVLVFSLSHTWHTAQLPSAKGAFTVRPLFIYLSFTVVHDDSFSLSLSHLFSFSIYLGHIPSLMPTLLLTP